MYQKSKRYERLRHMVRELNKDRRRRARKVDILCHDLVDAQRSFIGRLETVSFAASFYRSLLGVSDLIQMLRRASEQIENRVPHVSVSFFLVGSGGCQEVPYDDSARQESRLEGLLDESVREAICGVNRVNSLEDLVALGLQVNGAVTGNHSLATVPLAWSSRPLGFILLHREGRDSLQSEDLQQVSSVCPGFSQAIAGTERFSRFA